MFFDVKIKFLEVFCFRYSNFQVRRTFGVVNLSEIHFLTSKTTQMTSTITEMTSKITEMTSRASKHENGRGPRGGVGEGFEVLFFGKNGLSVDSTRPEARGLGGLYII